MQAEGSEDSNGDKKWRKRILCELRTILPLGSQRFPYPVERYIHWIKRWPFFYLISMFKMYTKSQDYTIEKDSPFNKWCWGNSVVTYKRMKLNTKSNSNGLKT